MYMFISTICFALYVALSTLHSGSNMGFMAFFKINTVNEIMATVFFGVGMPITVFGKVT